MPIGISGSNIPLIGNQPAQTLAVVELRTQTNILQSLLGSSQAIDELNTVRNDQAVELGISTPLPGASM